jgi:hypothetical protein
MNIFDWRDWRYLFRHKIGGLFQRAHRGYADHDLWSFDLYISGVLAGGLRQLAARAHGYPCDFPGGFDGWQLWLREKADWFEWYCKDEDGTSEELGWIDPTLTTAEKRRRMDAYNHKMEQFFNQVLPDFCTHFGGLWD